MNVRRMKSVAYRYREPVVSILDFLVFLTRAMWKEITQEKTLSNNRTLRGLSDWLDGKGFRGAGRAFTHAMYHACIGSAKFVCFNR